MHIEAESPVTMTASALAEHAEIGVVAVGLPSVQQVRHLDRSGEDVFAHGAGAPTGGHQETAAPLSCQGTGSRPERSGIGAGERRMPAAAADQAGDPGSRQICKPGCEGGRCRSKPGGGDPVDRADGADQRSVVRYVVMFRHHQQIETLGRAWPHQLHQEGVLGLALEPAGNRRRAPSGGNHQIRPGRLSAPPGPPCSGRTSCCRASRLAGPPRAREPSAWS